MIIANLDCAKLHQAHLAKRKRIRQGPPNDLVRDETEGRPWPAAGIAGAGWRFDRLPGGNMTKKWLMPLALTAAVLASSFVLVAETPVGANSCSGTRTMKVPAGCYEYGQICDTESKWVCEPPPCSICGGATCGWKSVPVNCHYGCKSPGYVYTSTNGVLFGSDESAPCACPFEGNGPVTANSCPNPKP
jgi:hypothetical protein